MHGIRRIALHAVLGLAAAGCLPAKGGGEVDARTAVIEGILAALQAGYVYPDKAAEMDRAVRARMARGEYDHLGLDQAFADSLTAHLRAVSPDKHLEVVFIPGPPVAITPSDGEISDEALRRMAEELRQEQFGLERVEILEGNVGLLDLRAFAAVEVPGVQEAVAEAMDALSGTDALVIDLRRNLGGESSMVQLVASYLSGPRPVQLSSIYWRPQDRTEESWTLRDLPGARYGPERPVYILTSSRTFSAAEALAYDLKHLRRATLVGETTAGGAHPARLEPVSRNIAVRIPAGRAINPVTGTNWEGTGVEPDIQVDASAALPVAHRAALRSLLATASRPRRAELERLIQQIAEEE
jgi:hypothetical protein